MSVGLNDVASKFVEQAPAKERQAREQAQAAAATAPKGSAEDATSSGHHGDDQHASVDDDHASDDDRARPRTPEQAAARRGRTWPTT